MRLKNYFLPLAHEMLGQCIKLDRDFTKAKIHCKGITYLMSN